MGRNLEKTGISWHPAFCGAMEISLVSDKELFELLREYPLSKEPLRTSKHLQGKGSRRPCC